MSYNTQVAVTHGTPTHNAHESGEYPAVTNFAAEAASFGPAASAPVRLRPDPSQPSLSINRALHLGLAVYASMAPEERDCFHAKRRKPASFRALASAQGVPLSTLWRAFAIYQLYSSYPELAQYRRLGVAHISVILGVPAQYRLYFMRMAEIEGWSRTRLTKEVRAWEAHAASQELEELARVSSQVQDSTPASASGSS